MESKKMIKRILLIQFAFIFFTSCNSDSGWTYLFDGKNISGLRGYRQNSFPDSWEIINGTMKTKPDYGVDLISEEVFENFELELEWKVAEGGNSGIFYYCLLYTSQSPRD